MCFQVEAGAAHQHHSAPVRVQAVGLQARLVEAEPRDALEQEKRQRGRRHRVAGAGRAVEDLHAGAVRARGVAGGDHSPAEFRGQVRRLNAVGAAAVLEVPVGLAGAGQ